MTLVFSKYHGLGNDFILIDDRARVFPVEHIPQLCHRKFGIGADGLILLQPNITMRIFNSDGSEAESCGNGLRCFVLFLKQLGIIQETYWIEMGKRIIQAKCVGDRVALDMGAPQELYLDLQTEVGKVHYVLCGVPHVVQFVSQIEAVDLARLGPLLRHHRLFSPHGANVDVVEIQPDRSLRIRTFERGVEGETLACGTGAAACAALARKLYGLDTSIPVHFPGGSLLMEGNWMIGTATKVFEGQIS